MISQNLGKTRFKQFTVATLMIGSLGMTSCVSDEISPEVKAIYESQAAYLSAEAKLQQIEAEIKQLELELKEAQQEDEIVKAKKDLAEAEKELINTLLTIEEEIADKEESVITGYLSEYVSQISAIENLEGQIASKKMQLISAQEDLADGIVTRDEAIAAADLTLALEQANLVVANSELTLLQAVLDDPTSIGAQVLAAQEQVVDLEEENEVATARIKEINDTELTYGSDLTDYTDAKDALQVEQDEFQGATEALATANEGVSEAETALTDLGAPVNKTYADAIAEQATAEADLTAKGEALTEIQNDFTSVKYTNAITAFTAANGAVENAQEEIDDLDADTTDYEQEYDDAKDAYEADPTGSGLESDFTDAKNEYFANIKEREDANIALEEAQEELDEAKDLLDEFGDIAGELEEAVADQKDAQETKDDADSIVTAVEGLETAKEGVLTATQTLAEATEQLADAQAKVTAAEALISTDELTAYTTALDEIDSLNLTVSVNTLSIADLEANVLYLKALELELQDGDYVGADYDETLENIQDDITDKEAEINGGEDSNGDIIEGIQERISKAQEDKVTAEATKVDSDLTNEEQLAEYQSEIAALEAQIPAYKALAAKYLALTNEAIAEFGGDLTVADDADSDDADDTEA